MKRLKYHPEQVRTEDEKEQIRLAYLHKVPEAVPDMLKCKNWKEMEQIRWTYEDGFSEAVPEMLKCEEWEEMGEVRWAYVKGVPEAVPYMLKCGTWEEMHKVRKACENKIKDWLKMKQVRRKHIKRKEMK